MLGDGFLGDTILGVFQKFWVFWRLLELPEDFCGEPARKIGWDYIILSQ
jgi:hypothetical protein